MKISNWHTLNPKNGNNEINIQFPGVTLMRFRENAIDPCDPKLTDDDSEWMEYVNNRLRCIPPYWNKIEDDHHDHDDFEVCSSQNMLGHERCCRNLLNSAVIVALLYRTSGVCQQGEIGKTFTYFANGLPITSNRQTVTVCQ